MMDYKGYQAEVSYDEKAELFHGEVVNTRDVITFQGSSVRELKKAFRDSVEDYLDWCAQRGESPEQPFSGKFVVRLDPALHRALHLQARREKKSLNALVNEKLAR